MPRSDRVAVIVDFSGSLWHERADGSRRKDALDPEVAAYLGRLGPETRFLVVPFTHKIHALTEGPVDATPARIARAREDFAAARDSGRGDIFQALEFALSFVEIDRVVVVTDGAPTGGRRWEVGRIVDLTLERVSLRPVTFDVVLHGAPKRLAREWSRLASQSGGRLVAIDARGE